MTREIGARWLVLVALVLAVAVPSVARAQGDSDVAMAVGALLPPGYTVTYTQSVDLGGDGQMEAIFKATSAPQPGSHLEMVGIIVPQGSGWQIAAQATPFVDLSTVADIYSYPKNDRHPGFVIINEHQCGANCNAGTARLLAYGGGGNFPTILTSVNDRGTLSADPTSSAVTLTGPVYATANPRCCPDYTYTRTWTWQGNDPTGGNLVFAAAPDKTLPAWFARDGQALMLGLDSIVAPLSLGHPGDASLLAPLLAPMVTITDAANGGCTASAGAVAQALAQGLSAGSGAVWPTADGYTVALRWNNRALPMGAMADGCLLDAGQGGGYLMHLSRTADGFAGDALAAAPQITQLIPADAVMIPPV